LYSTELKKSTESREVTTLQSQLSQFASLSTEYRKRLVEQLRAPDESEDVAEYEEQLVRIADELPDMLRESLSRDAQLTAEIVIDFVQQSDADTTLPNILREYLSVSELKQLFIALLYNPRSRGINVRDLMRIVITHTRGINLAKGWTPDEIADLVAHIPRVPINNHVPRSSLDAKLLWAPEEIGEFVGKVVRDDMELDHVIGILDKLALTHWTSDAAHCTWQEYFGYVNVVTSSALAVNQDWQEEDFGWVVKGVTNDVGRWALRYWPEFRAEQYMEVVTDLVTQIALKWGRHTHDVQLIALLLSHSTAKWDNQLADKQAAMIEARMHSEGRTLGARLKGLLGQSTKQSEAHLPAVSDTSQLQTPVVHSSLWSPPDLSAENKSDSNNKKEHNS
jgi:hypothetical protein